MPPFTITHPVAADPARIDAYELHASIRSSTTTDFLMAMAAALSSFGSPAHRVEEAMTHCAQQLGIEATFFSLPTAVHAMFGRGDGARTMIARVPTVGVNLERLVQLDEIRLAVASGACSPREGSERLKAALALPCRHSNVTMIVAFGFVSAACAALFQGGIVEVLAAATTGLAIGVVDHFGSRFDISQRLLDFFSGLLASVVAWALARTVGPLAYDIALVAGLIVLMPGLTLTIAIKELSTLNLVAGTARMMYAFTVLAAVGFGVAVGHRIFGFGIGADVPPIPLPQWTMVPALLTSGTALAVLLQVRRQHFIAVMMVGAIGYTTAYLGTNLIGAEPGACIAAASVGIASNLWSRRMRVPSVVAMVPGIILLVPGSTGFRGVFAFLNQDSIAAVDAVFMMLFTAVALVTGLLLANTALPSRTTL